jgi:hypothetical protein
MEGGELGRTLINDLQVVAESLTDRGFQMIVLEQRLVNEHPQVVDLTRLLSSAPVVLLGSMANAAKWRLDYSVVCCIRFQATKSVCETHIPSTLINS